MRRASRRRPQVARRHLVIVALAALAIALWRALAGDPFTDGLEDRLLDLRFQLRGPEAPPGGVVVVVIDEASIDQLGWAPPPRGALARAVGRILEAGPRVVAIDLLFLDQTAADPRLAEALAPSDRVVLGAAVANLEAPGGAGRPPELTDALQRSTIAAVIGAPRAGGEAPRLLAPRPRFLGAPTLAHVNVARSADRVARRVPLALWIGEEGFLPSLSLEAARRLAGLARGEVALHPGRSVRFGAREIETDRAGLVAINHYGPRGTIPTARLVDVLDGRVPPGFFADRAVLVGASAESLSDLFATPFSADIPGVEVLATATANLAADELILRPRWGEALAVALAVLLAATLHLAARVEAPAGAAAVAAAAWLAGAGAVQLAFSAGRLWIDATTILAALLVATVWSAMQRLRAERRLAATLEVERENLARYQSPFLAEHLAHGATPEFDGRTQDAAVLFVDVAGYTTLVENAAPADTAAFLRELHRFYEACATPHRGVIVSFEGDGALIVFGLPDPRPDDAAAALDCGRRLLDEAGRFASAIFPDRRIELRVSVHHGPVTAAVLGGASQAQVTVTGDTVNVASRLQDAAKAHGVWFVASRATLDAAGAAEAAAGFTLLAAEAVRGRAGRVEVWAARDAR